MYFQKIKLMKILSLTITQTLFVILINQFYFKINTSLQLAKITFSKLSRYFTLKDLSVNANFRKVFSQIDLILPMN